MKIEWTPKVGDTVDVIKGERGGKLNRSEEILRCEVLELDPVRGARLRVKAPWGYVSNWYAVDRLAASWVPGM